MFFFKQNSILRNAVLLLLTASIVVATYVSLSYVRAAQEEPEQESKYKNLIQVNDAVAEITDKYHDAINDIFNQRINLLVKIGLEGTPEKLNELQRLVAAPEMEVNEEGKPVRRKTCSDPTQNILSTFCVSEMLLREYFDYRDHMLEVRKTAKFLAAQRFEYLTRRNATQAADQPIFEAQPMLGKDVENGTTPIQTYAKILSSIDRELDVARKAMDQGLAAYNELQMALPMHIKYKQLINALEDYRDKVRDVRSQVDSFPSTYLDITTPACT